MIINNNNNLMNIMIMYIKYDNNYNVMNIIM